MKMTAAFFRLIRWQNLLFILLTQALFYYCVTYSLYGGNQVPRTLYWLMAASVLIAAGGYVINDYFDLNIDQVNKPNRNVLNTIINRRWAILLHLVMSGAGILATIVAVSFQKWHIILANILCVVLLWFYSTSLKRRFLVGNIVISLLTAWTVLVLFFTQVSFADAFGSNDTLTIKFFRIAFLYGGFAFIISLIREAVKDIEDMEGDDKYGCRTMPIVAGVNATKVYISVWTVVLLAALVLLQFYIMQFRWWFTVVYSLLFVIIPLLWFFRKHLKARSTHDFAQLSQLTKWIMFTGILSMFFFRIYF